MSRPHGYRGTGLQNIFAQFNLSDKILSPFRVFWVDPANGSDNGDGILPDNALASLQEAQTRMTAGMHDTALVIGNGAASGTVRQSAALTWAKDCCHIIGISARSYNSRARIAPTAAITAFTPLVYVSASDCIFKNISVWHGFDTGVVSAIAWRDTGQRNEYENVSIMGMGDAESAGDADSRHLLLEGAESIFRKCIIGQDTVARGAVANASIEFKTTSCKRNTFEDCLFPFFTSAANPLGIKVALTGASDRWQRFVRCSFINAIGSTSTTMSALATLASSVGGLLLFEDCKRLGITEWGTDATSRNQMYIANSDTPNGHTAGEFVVSSQS